MSHYFRKIVFIIISCSSFLLFSKETKIYNPIWADSILAHKIDSVQMQLLRNSTSIDAQKGIAPTLIIQPLRNQQKIIDYIYTILILLSVLSLLYVFFGDYFVAARESLWSIKQYQVYLVANKFDNYFLLIALFFLKVMLISLATHLFVNIYVYKSYIDFNIKRFVQIVIAILFFYILKNLLEFIIVFVIDQLKVYRVFYYNKLFFDIIFITLVSLFMVLMYYNSTVNINLLYVWSLFYISYITYAVFKIYSISKISNIIYFILYICTFKIMPFLLLAKYLWLNLK